MSFEEYMNQSKKVPVSNEIVFMPNPSAMQKFKQAYAEVTELLSPSFTQPSVKFVESHDKNAVISAYLTYHKILSMDRSKVNSLLDSADTVKVFTSGPYMKVSLTFNKVFVRI